MAMPRSIPDSVRHSVLRRWAAGHSAQSILEWINETNVRRKEPVRTSLSSVERLIAGMQRGDHHACDLATVRRLRLDAQECRDNLADLHLKYMDLAANADVAIKTQTKAELALRVRMYDRAERIADRRIRLSGLAGAGAGRFMAANYGYIQTQERAIRDEDVAEEYEEAQAAKAAAAKAAANAQPAVEPPPAPVEVPSVEPAVEPPPRPAAAPAAEAPSDEKSLRLEGAKPLVSKAIEAKGCQDELEWDDDEEDDPMEESELRRMDGVVMTLIKALRPGENWEEVAKEIAASNDPPEPEGVVNDRICKDDGTVCQGLTEKDGTYTLKFPSRSAGG